MPVCTESGVELPLNVPKRVVAVCVGEDKSKSALVSIDLVEAIPKNYRSNAKRYHKKLGVNVCRARVIGGEGNVRPSFDPGTDFWFSLERAVLKRFLPNTAASALFA